jgi:hypothetical protein
VNLNRLRTRLDGLDRHPARDGRRSRPLRRLEVFVDVVYALITFQILSYLPPVRDMSWVGRPLGPLGPLVGNGRELWRVVMGVGITAICWYVGSRRLSRVRETDGVHTTLILLQTAIIYLFIYFAICDPTLAGGASSRALQCGSLALASALGQLAWGYARWRDFVDAGTPPEQLDGISRLGRVETATPMLNMPLAWVGTISWTLGWFVIPFMITRVLPRLRGLGRRSPGDGS